MVNPAMFDITKVRATAARYGASPVGEHVDGEPDFLFIPFYLTGLKGLSAPRIEIRWHENGTWQIFPHVTGGPYDQHEAENIIEVFNQAVALMKELNAL